MTSYLDMRKALETRGLIVGARDRRRNRAFKGEFMVAEPCDESLLPTDDAGHGGGFCIVGDNLNALIVQAYQNFED